MSTPKLTQSKLFEILVREIESLKKSSEQINQAYWKVEQYMEKINHRMDTYQVPVDIAPMQQETRRLELLLKTHKMVPSWAWKVTLAFIGILMFACFGLGSRVIYDYNQETLYWKQQCEHEQIRQEKEAGTKP